MRVEHKFEVFSAKIEPRVQERTLNGIEYYVAPVVMMVPGVWHGSLGKVLYSANELKKSVRGWNTKPLVVYHPKSNGEFISACQAHVLESRSTGMILNTKWQDNRLKTEAWVQKSRASKVDSRVLTALTENKPMEVSIGVFTDVIPMPGVYQKTNESYDGLAVNLMPDHLALLPDEKGACPMEAGAGLLVNALSHEELRDVLHSQLSKTKPEAWIEAVFNSFFIIVENGKYFKTSYTIEKNEATIGTDFVAVEKVTEYRALDGSVIGNNLERKEKDMSKDTSVDALMAALGLEGEDNKKKLSGLPDQVLAVLSEANSSPPDGKDDKDDELKKLKDQLAAKEAEIAKLKEMATPPADPPAKAEDKMDELIAAAAAKVGAQSKGRLNMKEYLESIPSEVRPIVEEAVNEHMEQKATLIANIKASDSCPFSDDELKAFSTSQLRKIANFGRLPEKSEGHAVFVGEPVVHQSAEPYDDPLPLPSMNKK